ncbi:BCCT family transporter [Haloplasma contractile]|uniref:Transporter BCCT family protein n=1 Tax=Haloplasma contractile SSD-17B TaxID=1033810 RepID=F7Q1L2_9MOLU|nr:BCCT family transporter [Haloplasma contractile]ERJ12943.1 Transporter BCCT family protein [Haloplasma contractile SSD-17B]
MELEQQAKAQAIEQEQLEKKLEEKLYSRNFTKFGLDMNPVVSITAGLIILLLSIYAFLNLEQANIQFNNVKSFIVTNADWVFILSSNFFIIVALYLAFSRLGRVRIGGVHAEPEFSNFAWYSMLISAGMGIGLMFWAVGEPLSHFNGNPPIFLSEQDSFTAMAATFFHWGLHPWGIYALISLALAYFAYNKKLPLSLRSVFYPIFKDKVFGLLGDFIDILAVLSCLFGLATSLGLGVRQINGGVSFLFPNIPNNTIIQVILIAVITAAATVSVVTGIDKGVQFLSKMNIRIAFVFMVAILLLGPTAYIIRLFSNSVGLYFNDFISSSFFLATSSGDAKDFQSGWSIFYLAWWISWSPFVGMFIARISKGRSIKEFILAVLIIPSLLSFVWLSVFGGTAMHVDQMTNGALNTVVSASVEEGLFEMINLLHIPYFGQVIKTLLSLIGTILVISFFVTSSDSGSLVVDNITSGGKLDSPVPQRVFWACMEGFIAAVLLLIGGATALDTLQTAVIATGLPFAIVLTIMTFLLLGSLQQTYKKQKRIRDVKQFRRLRKLTKRDSIKK